MRKFLLALAFALAATSATAQNTTCSNRAAGDVSNACANTRFVSGAIATAAPREYLTAARTYYVRSDGNDSTCTGRANAAAASAPACAFLTYAKAISVITTLIDFGGQTVTITNGNAATFTTGIFMDTAWSGGGKLIIDLGGGTFNTAGLAIWFDKFSFPSTITIQSTGGTGTLMGGGGITNAAEGTVVIGNGLNFGLTTNAHIQATKPGSYIEGTNGTTINVSGGAHNHLLVYSAARIDMGAVNVVFTANSAFTNFVETFEGGVIGSGAGTFTCAVGCSTVGGTATVTGTRFAAASNSLIWVFGGSATYFPGNAAGTQSQFGVYLTSTGIAGIPYFIAGTMSYIAAPTNAQLLIGQTGSTPTPLTVTGDVTIDNLGATAIGTAKVTSAMLRNSAALSVIGRSANSIGVPADLAASAGSGQILRESGSTIGWGSISTYANIFAGSTLGACSAVPQAATSFLGVNGCWTPTEANVQAPMARAGTASQLHTYVTAAPAAGQTYIFTLRKNTADTAVTCTISNPATACSDASNSVAYAVGDIFTLKVVASATSGAANTVTGSFSYATASP